MRTSAIAVLLVSFCVTNLKAQAAAKPFDIVIVNGHVIDGTGSPWYAADIGIRDGRIAEIGDLLAYIRKWQPAGAAAVALGRQP